MDHNTHQVFLSYASPDRDRVLLYYDWLRQEGFNAWVDCRCIKPGQAWEFEVNRALDKSSFVIAFVSRNSVDRRGYVQRELKLALDKRLEKLADDIYLIPVLLDDGLEIPEQLKEVQCISASEVDCRAKLADALTSQLSKLGALQERTQLSEGIYWDSMSIQESWDGLPGYEFELTLLSFNSERYPDIGLIGDHIRGTLLKDLFSHRAGRFAQEPERYNYGQDRYLRTNTYDAHCGEPVISGRILTVQYAVHTYGAGAAHPNYHFETFGFLLSPVIPITSLHDIFLRPAKALQVIKSEIRAQLMKVRLDESLEEEGVGLDREWVESGTKSWNDLRSFVFRQDRLEFLFAPYSVAAYACGAQFAEIQYEMLAPLMKLEIRSALEIEHMASRSTS